MTKDVKYQGKIFEVYTEEQIIEETQVVFEYAKRMPGVRILIVDKEKILLTKEYRYELGDYDYRLPGGKVFDTYKEYEGAKNVLTHAKKAAKKECTEETGLTPKTLTHIHTTSPGGTVQWDLYYFLVTEFAQGKQELGHGEDIKTHWFTKQEVKHMCISGIIQEDRTVAVLLRYLEGAFS